MKKIVITLIMAITATSSATIINIPADWPTIQAGINASMDGDTVLVQPGTYYEIIDYFGHNVIVASLFLTTGDTSYISSTIIDGIGIGPVVTFQNGENSDAALVGFTIQNGYKDNGAGIRCMFDSSPIIRNNIITDNVGYRNCGGIYCLNGSNPMVRENIIIGNNSSLEGGGILSVRSSPYILNNIITENFAGRGGGIYIGDSSFAVIEGNRIFSNSCLASGGAGISVDESDLIIVGNIISNNSTLGDGAGIRGYYSNLIIIGCLINLNNAGSDGGGVSIWHSELLVKNTIIADNIASQDLGGGIFAYSSTPDIYNSIIYRNSCSGAGGGAYIGYYRANIVNSIFLQNEAVWGEHQIGGDADSISVFYSNIEGGWPGVGNIDVDPLFRDPANNDFHLMSIACGDSADSPCIDVAHPAILDSLLDCSWGLGGPRSDMGAYGGGDSLMTSIFENISALPDRIMLFQNYPNPFNARTTIRFVLLESQDVQLTVYDLLGRRVETLINEYVQAGAHAITWDASDVSSGVYFYKLQTEDKIETKRMILLK